MDRYKLQKRRAELGLTLQEVATRMGLTKATVQKYESGYIKGIETTKLEQLANALECTPAYLMGWEEEKKAVPSCASSAQKELLSTFEQLNEEGREKVMSYAKDLVGCGSYGKKDCQSSMAKEKIS